MGYLPEMGYLKFLEWLKEVKLLGLTFKRQPHTMVKHTQTNRRLLPTNCFSVFYYFAGLALKGLRYVTQILNTNYNVLLTLSTSMIKLFVIIFNDF